MFEISQIIAGILLLIGFVLVILMTIKDIINIIRSTKFMHNLKIEINREGASYFDNFTEDELKDYWEIFFTEESEMPLNTGEAIEAMVDKANQYCKLKGIN
ncbi:hypothetical protein ABGV42_01640 [Paenibacillus pabuli]|uniref:hypothetical protein n=1 Tax=Paenibacillus pabuli TaxID=1472 RepID=UPI00324222DF